jgi:hypothetical protein
LNVGDGKKFDRHETVLKLPAGMRQHPSPERMVHPVYFKLSGDFPNRADLLFHVSNRFNSANALFFPQIPAADKNLSEKLFTNSQNSQIRHRSGTGATHGLRPMG